MSTERIDLLARKFVDATQNHPVYVYWGQDALEYTADDAEAFLTRGDESAPTLEDALFDEGRNQELSLDKAVLYWIREASKNEGVLEVINEVVTDGDFDEESLAYEVAERVREEYFEDVRFDESEFFKSVEDGILTYGALLTAGDPDYIYATAPELEDAEELLGLTNGRVNVSPEKLLGAMQEVPDDFYSLWCVVSMPQRVLLDAFHGSKTIDVSSPTIYIGNFMMGAYYDFKIHGALTLKLDEMSPYFAYLDEYYADEIE